MRSLLGVTCVVLILASGSAFAGPPRDGVYSSQLGQLAEGRYSESWIGGGHAHPGNTLHAQSWNGTMLGAQWEVSCPILVGAPVLLDDSVDESGNGHRTFRTLYTGGRFWLTGTGTWSGGDMEYSGDLVYYTHTTTYQYLGFQVVSYVINAQLAGYFDGYGKCMQLTIANAVNEGSGQQTRSYPVFLNGGAGCIEDTHCAGEWGEVHSITMVVMNCSSGVEPRSWSMLKSLYR